MIDLTREITQQILNASGITITPDDGRDLETVLSDHLNPPKPSKGVSIQLVYTKHYTGLASQAETDEAEKTQWCLMGVDSNPMFCSLNHPFIHHHSM